MKDIYHSDNLSVVVYNNVLVDLYEIERLNLLFEVFDHVIIPRIIYETELPSEVKSVLNQFDYKLGAIETTVGLETYGILTNNVEFRKLSKYDRFAISIAKENCYYCNSNDKPVRNACEKLNVRYTGVLGVIGRAYVRNQITLEQFNDSIDLIISAKTSCYIDLKVIELFKEEIKHELNESNHV